MGERFGGVGSVAFSGVGSASDSGTRNKKKP